MTRILRTQVVLGVVVTLAGAVCFAQSPGQATYKAKCQMCHGATGTPSPGMARMMSIKPVFDPVIKALSADKMFTAVKNGKGKMKPVAGLRMPDQGRCGLLPWAELAVQRLGVVDRSFD